jgi:SAM-dependent methyltransferase
VKGIDVSETAIRIGKENSSLVMSTESFSDLAASGASFDVVTAFEVLEHLETPVRFVSEAMSLLKPGGHFFCTVPNRCSPTVLATNRPDWLPPIHLQFYTEPGLTRLLKRAGLTSVCTGLISSEPRARGGRLRRIADALKGRSGEVRPDPLGIWAFGRVR